MSAQGDALRAQAAALEVAAMSPWTAALPDVAKATATQMRDSASRIDQVVALSLPGVSAIVT